MAHHCLWQQALAASLPSSRLWGFGGEHISVLIWPQALCYAWLLSISTQVYNIDSLITLIGNRFGHTLRYIELPCELIQGPVLHELANKCPNLKHLTLDFASAMQLHDFNDLNAFPCNLKNLTICLSEVIFMEGFMRKVYQSLSSLEVLHLIGR